MLADFIFSCLNVPPFSLLQDNRTLYYSNRQILVYVKSFSSYFSSRDSSNELFCIVTQRHPLTYVILIACLINSKPFTTLSPSAPQHKIDSLIKTSFGITFLGTEDDVKSVTQRVVTTYPQEHISHSQSHPCLHQRDPC